jgi:iron complex transport system substrate-binding protein
MGKWFIGFLFLLLACNSEKQNTHSEENFIVKKNECARHFVIKSNGSKFVMNVLNPWQLSRNINYTYNFCNGDSNESKIIHVPVKRVICFSTSHIGFISLLNEQNSLVGFSGIDYINDSIVRQMINENKIVDVGYEESLNYELILSLKPDIILVYGVESEKVSYLTKLEELGLPVVFVAEYLEDSPLAKAEWIRFFGVLFDKEEFSDSLYGIIVSEYNNVKEIASSYQQRPTVFSGLPWKDSWFVSGGNSYLAQFIRDAGGDYVWKDDTSHESYPLNLERVYQKAATADIWINSGSAKTMNEIKFADERLTLFKAFSAKKIYNNNKRSENSEGNDYWESGVVKPQVILKDLVEIFHPGSFVNYTPYFYKHLESR